MKNINNLKKKELRTQPKSPLIGFETGIPIPEPFSDNAKAYETHALVYSCVWAIVSNFASVPFKAYRLNGKGEYQEVQNHPLIELINKPNPYYSMGNLLEFTCLSLELSGNAYWAMESLGTSKIKEIWPLMPESVKIKTSKEKFIESYIHKVGSDETIFKPSEIMHFKYISPSNLYYGQGSLMASKYSLTQDYFAQNWNKSFFQNSGRIDAILESENPIDPESGKRIRAAWEKMHSGAPNRGKTAILDSGLKYKEVNRSHSEMDFIELRKFMREEIMQAFGVPPVVVGIFEYANYANSKEQVGLFWRHTMIPKIRAFESVLNLKAKQIFGDYQTVFQADLSNVEALRVDESQRANVAKLYVDMGIPPNQVIEALDLPFEPFEGGDESRKPQQQTFQDQPVKAVSKSFETKDSANDVAWKRFDQSLREFEGPFQNAMEGFFKAQKKRVVKRFNKIADRIVLEIPKSVNGKLKDFRDDIESIISIEIENEYLNSIAGKHIRRTFSAFGQDISATINAGIDFNLNDPHAEAWLDNKTIQLSKNVNQFTKEQISDAVADAVKEAISEGFDQGETIQQIVDRIDDVYKFAVETRAERIARTEVISASNAGAVESMRQLGATSKMWISSRDEKVRDTHKELDGSVVKLNEQFVSNSGSKLSFPGDPSGGPSEIINCRCAVAPAKGDE